MSTTALPRPLLRALHVMVLAGAVGLAAGAAAPAGTPTAAPAPALAAATDVVAAPTTTPPAIASDPAPTTAPVSTAPTATAATAGVVAAGAGAPTVGAAPVGAQPTGPAAVAVKPVPAPAPRTPALLAVVVAAAAPAAAAPAPAGDGVVAQAARAVFDATNTFRRQNGVAPLTWSTALQRSAHQHNLAMAGANQMSHQVPDEASFDTRISNQGVPWLSVGENVGFNKDRTMAGALALHTMMINEVAPNDDHKVNKLDPLFTTLGVDVYLDTTTGKLWFTEDYAQI